MKSKDRFNILVLSIFPAPYRVGVFNLMGKEHDVTVLFEGTVDEGRSKEWFINSFESFDGYISNMKGPIKIDLLKKIGLLKNIDFVFAYDYSTPTALILMEICKIKNIPYFINCDGGFVNNSKLKSILKRHYIRNAKACLANGNNGKDYFLHYGAEEEDIYEHNFTSLYERDILKEVVSNEIKEKLREELDIDKEKKIVVTVGRFIKLKGFDVLIRSWSSMPDNYNLIMIGGGEEEKEYENLIKELNIKNIDILKFKPKEELKKYYMAADLFVLPTRQDVWGLVINEAMACGLPVITTDMCIAGLQLIENNKNGFIVPIDNEMELAKRICEVLECETLRNSMIKNNLNKIKTYTIENIAKGHIEILHNY